MLLAVLLVCQQIFRSLFSLFFFFCTFCPLVILIYLSLFLLFSVFLYGHILNMLKRIQTNMSLVQSRPVHTTSLDRVFGDPLYKNDCSLYVFQYHLRIPQELPEGGLSGPKHFVSCLMKTVICMMTNTSTFKCLFITALFL